MTTLALVLGTALTFAFFCSLLEAILVSTSLSYIADLDEAGDPVGRALARMRENPEVPLLALGTLRTTAVTVGAILSGAISYHLWDNAGIAGFCAVATLLVLVCGEVLPRTLGSSRWRDLTPFAARTVPLLVRLMTPLTAPLRLLDRLLATKGRENQRVSRAEFEAMAEIDRRQAGMEEEEWEVVTNVMNLDQVTVGEVMTPRIDMVAVPVDASVDVAMDLMLEEGHLRIPVFNEAIDHIVGVLLARDLWRADREGIPHIRDIVRPATFVPSSKPVEDLLREMRELRIKMAIVLDEYGGTAGLVTLEDLVEEIIGEIQDEHEQEPLPFEEEIEGEIRIRGEVALWEVNERFGLDLPEDVFDTLGGFVFGQLGRIPNLEDEVETEKGSFRVVAMDGRRVTRVAYAPDPRLADEIERKE